MRAATFAVLLLAATAAQSADLAPVKVLAFEFSDSYKRLTGAVFTHVETATNYTVGRDGVTTLHLPVGSNVTLTLHKFPGFVATTGATMTVPPGGMVTNGTEYVLQVPPVLVYDLFVSVTPGHKDKSKCQFVVTVCGPNRTWWSFPQGIPGVSVTMDPPLHKTIFYFGTWGKLSNDTNPLPNGRNVTSWDGGVLIEDVPVAPGRPYVITATKPGYAFTRTVMSCTAPGQFVNGGPGQGPVASHADN